MTPVGPGDRVTHPAHGPGLVLLVRSGGRAFVRFDRMRFLPRTLPVGELEPEGAAAPVRRAAAAPEPGRGAGGALNPFQRAERRQAIEALRAGVVPAAHVLEYTVGREAEVRSFEELLVAGGGFRLIWGDYGAGKTHLLDVFQQLAHQAGFATARVVLDPRDVPPSHPQRLYRAIVASMRYPDDPGEGLDPLLARLDSSEEHMRPGGRRFSRFLSPVLFARERGDLEALRWVTDYIEGYPMDWEEVGKELRRIGWRGPRLLVLSDYRTYGRMYVNLVGTLASWARDAGWRGLVLLLDEVEYVDALDSVQRRLALEVIQHYAAVTLPPGALRFDPDGLYRGGHEVHRGIPLRFDPDQPLGAVLALTPLREILRLISEALREGEHALHLRPFARADHAELVRKVTALYRSAHPGFDPPTPGLRGLGRALREDLAAGHDSPRELVRSIVFRLDALRCARALAGIA